MRTENSHFPALKVMMGVAAMIKDFCRLDLKEMILC